MHFLAVGRPSYNLRKARMCHGITHLAHEERFKTTIWTRGRLILPLRHYKNIPEQVTLKTKHFCLVFLVITQTDNC